MFAWITGWLLLAWLVCPVAAIVIVKEINLFLRRRAARHQRQMAARHSFFESHGGAR